MPWVDPLSNGELKPREDPESVTRMEAGPWLTDHQTQDLLDREFPSVDRYEMVVATASRTRQDMPGRTQHLVPGDPIGEAADCELHGAAG